MQVLFRKLGCGMFGLLVVLLCVIVIETREISIQQYTQENIKINSSYISRIARNRYLYIKNGLSSIKTRDKQNAKNFHSSIRFIYHKNGEKTFESLSDLPGTLEKSKCTKLEKFAFIIHGWKQSCNTEWVPKLIDRLNYHRGGCIVCIDYSILANLSYMRLYRNFKFITTVIAEKIANLIYDGINLENGFMFGFSYGGQLASSIGRTLAPSHIFKQIDICDMAGPGFDLAFGVDHRTAGEHVQCLHSSRDKGTHIYSCHQNIRLGNCGYDQPAVKTQPYYSNHGLCVQIYINAFDFPFYAIHTRPLKCFSKNPANYIPHRFTIGYKLDPKSNVEGEIFVPTGLNYPYNLSEKDLQFTGVV